MLFDKTSTWYMYTRYRDIYASIFPPPHTPHTPPTLPKTHSKTQPYAKNRYATPTPKPIQQMLSHQPFLQAYPSLPKPQPRTRIPHPRLLLLFRCRGRQSAKPNPHLRIPHARYRSRLQLRLLLLLLGLWRRCGVAGSDGSGHRFFLLWPRVRGVGL